MDSIRIIYRLVTCFSNFWWFSTLCWIGSLKEDARAGISKKIFHHSQNLYPIFVCTQLFYIPTLLTLVRPRKTRFTTMQPITCFSHVFWGWWENEKYQNFPWNNLKKKKVSCDSSLNSVIIGDSTELHCSLMGRDNAGQPRPNNYLVLHTYLLTIHNTWKRNGILHSPHLMQRVLQLDMTIDETCFFEAIQTFVLGQLCMHGGS